MTAASAAELLRDSLSGTEYTYTYNEYTRYQGWQLLTKTDTNEAVSPDKEMTEFITEASRIIRDDAAAGTDLIFSKSANISAEEADTVSADFSLQYTGHNSGTENYELLVRIEISGTEDEASGYRMEMRLRLLVRKPLTAELQQSTDRDGTAPAALRLSDGEMQRFQRGGKMMRKLKSCRGETITEVLVSLLIAVISISLLMSSVAAASKINAKVKKSLTEELQFEYETAVLKDDGTEVTVDFGSAAETATIAVRTYESNGYRFYVRR